MKTNTKRFAGFLLTLVMIVAMFTMMSVSASAEEAGSADILGTYVNLGGDIELNYAVQLDEGVDIQDVKLRTVFLGVEKYLTATESDFNGVYYTFTLEGINPQCLGDEIDAELYIGDKKVDELLDFSVEDNMLLLKADSKLTDDEFNLIEALLAYGKASEAYTGHTSMTGSYAISSYEPLTYEANINDSSSVVSVQSANVRFGTTTYLMFTFTFDNDTTPFDLAGKVTIDAKIATTYMADNTCVAISAPISPENFHKDVAVNYNDELNFTFSVNDYCYIVTKEDSTASESMKTLAKALYNYGIYAHIVSGEHIGGDGTATCEHGKICSVCGEYYGETLEHSYSYTANDDDNTITAACVNGCGHSQTIELKAPENAIYNGNKIEATVTGADGITYELTYNADPVGAGTYTATLTVGDKSVSVDFSIAKATPTYEVPTGLTATYGDTLANVEGLPTGWTWKDAESTSVGNAGTRTFKALYNPDSNNYNTVEADITVEVAKALIDIYIDNLINPEFAEGLIYNDTAQALVTNSGSIDGGYIVFSLNPDGEYTTEIPVATEAGEYVVYYRIEGDENHYWEGSSAYEAVTIAKANPEYTVPTGLTATYGDTLANVELPTGWAWKDAETTSVGNAGTRTFKAVFTPADTVNYNTVEADVTVEVAKANPEYTVPTGLTATYGDTLAKVELPAGWTWNDAETTFVGNAGTSTFKATFTPADTTNYIVVESEVTITVAKAEIDGSTLINPKFAEGLIYNGTAQALVTKTGSVDGGYIVYSLSIDGEYTTTIPVATEAGNYRVYWTIECDENHYVDGTPGSSRVTIAAKDASNATVTLDDTSVQFDGTAKTPGVTSVVVDGKTLNAETDYEVSYRDNTYVGTATVTITFKGNYTGTATVTFEIIQDPKTGEFDGEWVQM